MPRMIPRILDPNTPSTGERDFFNRISLAEGIDDWVILHSLNIAHHQKRIMGEIDFLILIPELGALAVEIKSHRYIEVRDGIWFMGKKDTVGSPRSPFVQLTDSMFSVQKYISNHSSTLSVIPIFPLVIFTHFEFTSRSIEWNGKQFISCKEYRNKPISEMCKQRINSMRSSLTKKASAVWFRKNSQRPNKTDIRDLTHLLRPSIEPARLKALFREEISKELIKFTAEQFNALDTVEDNTRVLFDGSAGTGKTFIAVEAATRAANDGKKVLLVCMNKLLSEFLQKELVSTSVTVVTLHALLKSYDPAPAKKYSDYWDTQLPETAYLNMLNDIQNEDLYDLLIIDEGQDIVKNNLWLDCLDIVLTNGLTQGQWYIFGDFTFQSIYSGKLSARELISNLTTRCNVFTRAKLKKNCRNIKTVSELSLSLAEMKSPYSSYLRQGKSLLPSRYHLYESEKEQIELLKSIVAKCLKEGFQAMDIVILSKVAEARSISHRHNLELSAEPFDSTLTCLRYTSIHKFKGLESQIVILTDIDEIESDEGRKILFTGASRATDSVYYLFHKEIKQTLIRQVSLKE